MTFILHARRLYFLYAAETYARLFVRGRLPSAMEDFTVPEIRAGNPIKWNTTPTPINSSQETQVKAWEFPTRPRTRS